MKKFKIKKLNSLILFRSLLGITFIGLLYLLLMKEDPDLYPIDEISDETVQTVFTEFDYLKINPYDISWSSNGEKYRREFNELLTIRFIPSDEKLQLKEYYDTPRNQYYIIILGHLP